MTRPSLALACIVLAASFGPAHATGPAQGIVLSPPQPSSLEILAAKEVRRYVYLRTGQLLPILESEEIPQDARLAIVVARKDRALLDAAAGPDGTASIKQLRPQACLLRTTGKDARRVLLVVGGDDVGTLYGAYRFAEHLGVRFYLHGDTLPDQRTSLELPQLDEEQAPLFTLRGIQPFHDFAEGPDWWEADDYKAILAQAAKMRMNFLGLHTYPENAPTAEPTVWIGPASEIGEGAAVKASYASSYQTTLRGKWGYNAKKTSDFAYGADLLFDRDCYGPEVMRDMGAEPQQPSDQSELFRRTGELLRDALTYARGIGIRTCVGTETPLIVPKALAERLKAAGTDPAAVATRQKLYEGMFRRIMQTYPIDYYWFWTPEGWTWSGTTQEQIDATVSDIKAAVAAAEAVKATFGLATCGWVLGPQTDRSLFDNVLPKNIALSCINRQVGMTPVEQGFANVKGRSKWAIPWLEDDPGLTSPQLWAGRMRRDAANALAYGCDGLMGIHWRTRVLAPNVSALAMAAWDQTGWKKDEKPYTGPMGGDVANYPNNKIEGTEDAPLYQTVRYNLPGYRICVPNGAYTVTLQFCEVHYKEANKRVFSVELQGKPVIDKLDVFAKVGPNKALDYTFKDVSVTNGQIEIDFAYNVELPCIAAIVVSGPTTVKINCGGPAYKDYIADPAPPPRDLPVHDFYQDWARQNFGAVAGEKIAAIFDRIDGKLPRPSDWVDGPGGVRPDGRPWSDVRKEYAFVDELAALRDEVRGPADRERFDYWLNTFRYMRELGHLRCIWGRYNAAMDEVKAKKDVAARKDLAVKTAVPLRREMVKVAASIYGYLLAIVSNPGELGTVANFDQHILVDVFEKPAKALSDALGEPLAANLLVGRNYAGPPRVIVPTVRSHLTVGEALTLKVILLAAEAPRETALHWRSLGKPSFASVPLKHVSRGVYTVRIPAEAVTGTDFEYYVQAIWDEGKPVVFPASAPERNQTVVVTGK